MSGTEYYLNFIYLYFILEIVVKSTFLENPLGYFRIHPDVLPNPLTAILCIYIMELYCP